MWLFDTGLNPKRPKQLRLIFVDKHTAFPIAASSHQTSDQQSPQMLSMFSQPILINHLNQLKNPDNDKRLTFTLNNKQLVCLIQFNQYTACQSFFKFYSDLAANPRSSYLFKPHECNVDDSRNMLQPKQKPNANHSRSLLTLTKLPSNSKMSNKKTNRYSNVIEGDLHDMPYYLSECKMRSSQTCDNLIKYTSNQSTPNPDANNKERVRITGITKSCISNPCAFQHINSIKDDDHRVKLFINFKSH